MDLIEKTENLKRHPWELSRSQKIIDLLKNNDKNFLYADIGSGDKFFTSKLFSITECDVVAIDDKYKNTKSEENRIICLNDISFLENQSVDCVILMDVLEHIQNEHDFLKKVVKKLKPTGKVIITVPAMQFLFSSHDVFLKHYRRYSRNQLLNLLTHNGLIIEKNFYFYSQLFLFRCISIFIEKFFLRNNEKKKLGIGSWSYSEHSFITRFIVLILNIDFEVNKLLSKMHIYLPGLSLLAICRVGQRNV
ncbi:MAG: methyltransferase domain-containing protein [Desulfobacterales bacterium]|nr:methyltransferase domain-containing protein [Desulfobacterales bacterium]